MNVLIVEDERQLSHEIETFLMHQGYHCDVAFTGKSASEKVFVNTYDFVLLDIGLPGISGYEACRRIRVTEHGRNIAMIALTGMGEISDRHSAIEAGFDEHIVKPVAYGDLDRILAKLTVTKH